MNLYCTIYGLRASVLKPQPETPALSPSALAHSRWTPSPGSWALKPGTVHGRLLSEVAGGMSEAEVLQMEAAVLGFPLYLTDVAPGVPVGNFFRQWAGDFTVESQEDSDEGARSPDWH